MSLSPWEYDRLEREGERREIADHIAFMAHVGERIERGLPVSDQDRKAYFHNLDVEQGVAS